MILECERIIAITQFCSSIVLTEAQTERRGHDPADTLLLEQAEQLEVQCVLLLV